MSRIDANMSRFLHTYEAYRVLKGTNIKDTASEQVVLNDKEDMLVLTGKSSKQLVKDRQDYSNMLQMQAQMAAQKTQVAASEKSAKDLAKIMAVYRAMTNGDIVPASDEKKLMDYDSDLYQAAKLAQAIAQQQERKEHESQWDEEEEEAHRTKMEELRDESDKAAGRVVTGVKEFSDAQKENIVELDTME